MYSYYGLLQAFADALKLLLKEYVAPTQANIVLFFLGPVITLIFALLGYAVIPYGPGLTVNDFSLGIYYMLAVSSLATYGILLAGFFLPVFNLHTNNTQYYLSHKSKSKFVLNFHIKISKYPNLSRCFIHTNQHHNNNNNSNMNSEEYIQEIFKDRVAPVIPFDRNLIKDSCFNYTDKILKAKFLKEWGTKAGIYLIEYKYYPNIYYIGRTNLFKKRFFEHSKAESNSKFHLFIRLIGIEHFNFHIIEVSPVSKLGEKETYYLQKYIPILNSVFSSSITEGVIKQSLSLKLKDLRFTNKTLDSRDALVYVYEYTEKEINPKATIYNSSNEASRSLAYPISGIGRYKNTSIPYRGKLFFNYPITDFNQVFKESQKLTPKGLLNRVVSTPVWAYDAATLELLSGSPFASKFKASKALGIPKATLNLVIDKGRTAGSKAIYVYSRPLNTEEIQALIAKVGDVQLGIKIPVYAYEANTLELVNNAPFDSLSDAANYFGVDYRTIVRHLNTNKATRRGGILVYFFKKKLDRNLNKQLIDTGRRIADSRSYNTKVWVYNAYNLELINHRPFDSILSAANHTGIAKSTLYRNLDSKNPTVLRNVKLTVYFLTKEMSLEFKDKIKKSN
jgi:NADH dehydrogenase/NUMOD1 domain/GIY-YIG catalytic domain